VDHHAVCEHNLQKLLFNNGFILVECRCQRIRDDKGLIFFGIIAHVNLFVVTSLMMS